MADAVVSYAIQKIGDAIINEARFLESIRQQAEDLKRELTWIDSFLRDADAKARGGNKLIQDWVKEVRKAAYDAEDLIESIAIQGSEPGIGQKRRRSDPGAHTPSDDCGMEIEELKQRIKNIRESAAGYGITALPDDRGERRHIDGDIGRGRGRGGGEGRAPALHALDSPPPVVLMPWEMPRKRGGGPPIFTPWTPPVSSS